MAEAQDQEVDATMLREIEQEEKRALETQQEE